jgi:pimeloyl-ACP methyl ester carboxylesterase
VLIHGLGGSHLNWDPIAGHIRHLGHIVALDLPGFGLSPTRTGDALANHRGAVIEVIETLGAPVTLLANSMGGLVAEMVAWTRPDLVSAQVLVAPATPLPPATLPSDTRTFARLAVQSLPVLGPAIVGAFQQRFTPAEQVRLTAELVAADPASLPHESVLNATELAAVRRTLPWSVAGFADSAASIRRNLLRRSRFVKMVGAIAAPTLLIHGTADRIVSPASIRWLRDLRPDWHAVEMTGLGHVPMLEAPATTAALIIEWKTQARGVGGRGYSDPPGQDFLSTGLSAG